MTRSSYNDVRVCMVAYANYFTDARIKNYVDALLDAGACVDVFALGRRKGTRNDGTLFIRALASKHWGSHPAGYVIAQAIFMLKVVLFLCARSFRRRYDIIHVHNMPNILTLTGLPFKLFGTKVILDIHDTMPEAYATKFDYSLDSLPVKLLRLEENIAARCSDRIIATNVLHKDVLISHGLPGETIDIILNVGNGKIFKPKPTVTNGAELWLGYHGTIARRLGVLLIVDAMHLLKDVCPCLRLLCIGEGDDLDSMRRHADERDVSDRIVWEPFTDVEKLPQALQRVQLGVIGNLRETEDKQNYMLPVKMLEYAAMEIPTVAPRLKVLTRYFDDTTAFFYEPDDPTSLAHVLNMIYRDRSAIASKTEGLRRFNARFNWDQMARRYLNIIDELMTPRR